MKSYAEFGDDLYIDYDYACPFQGYCYTQVSDVQQEVNGLLDEYHKPKFDVERLAKIFC